MRIALVSTCALATPPKAYGGTELVVAELAKALVRLGHELTTYATGDSELPGEVRYHFETPVWPPNDLAELRHAAFAFRDMARRAAYDVIHVHHAAALPLGLLSPSPVVLTVHHAREPELVEHYRAFRSAAYVAISQRQAELSPELTFARVIHHGLDPELYEAGHGDGGYVAFVGRFAPEKAPHLAIEAARRASMPIRLAGAPQEVTRQYFEAYLEAPLRQPFVTWCGELGHAPKLELLQGARCLLVPIEWEEPFGLVMIEAMLVGTPVIAFARGSAPEIVEPGVTGFLVRDLQEMRAAIGSAANIDRRRCRERARERWSALRMAQEYVALFEDLVRQRRQRRIVHIEERRGDSAARHPTPATKERRSNAGSLR